MSPEVLSQAIDENAKPYAKILLEDLVADLRGEWEGPSKKEVQAGFVKFSDEQGGGRVGLKPGNAAYNSLARERRENLQNLGEALGRTDYEQLWSEVSAIVENQQHRDNLKARVNTQIVARNEKYGFPSESEIPEAASAAETITFSEGNALPVSNLDDQEFKEIKTALNNSNFGKENKFLNGDYEREGDRFSLILTKNYERRVSRGDSEKVMYQKGSLGIWDKNEKNWIEVEQWGKYDVDVMIQKVKKLDNQA